MESARLFNCACCHEQVIICSICDRNNIYCGSKCSQSMRAASLRMAGQRYQKTLRGRHQHAERQRRYRIKKVTHHTSSILAACAVLPAKPNERMRQVDDGYYHCHFCGNPCSEFFRRGYLRHSSPSRSSFWPLGP